MNEVTIPETFQTRLERKIQESIGELMTPDDVKRLVEAGIQKALFQKRQTARSNWNGYGDRFENRPPLVDELVTKHFQDMMTKAVTEWLKEHPEAIEPARLKHYARGRSLRGRGRNGRLVRLAVLDDEPQHDRHAHVRLAGRQLHDHARRPHRQRRSQQQRHN